MNHSLKQESFVIREATVDDIPILVRQRCEMFKDMGQLNDDAYRPLAEASARYFREAIPAGKYRAWLVLPSENPEVVVAGGGVQLRETLPRPGVSGDLDPPTPQALIVNVYTEKEWRRQGLAELVTRTIINWCVERKVVSIVLHASELGRPLYERLGFLPTNEMNFPLS